MKTEEFTKFCVVSVQNSDMALWRDNRVMWEIFSDGTYKKTIGSNFIPPIREERVQCGRIADCVYRRLMRLIEGDFKNCTFDEEWHFNMCADDGFYWEIIHYNVMGKIVHKACFGDEIYEKIVNLLP